MNTEYYNKGKNILYTLNHSFGYQAFFVGDVVRAYIDNSDCSIIEICTDAPIEKLQSIFGEDVIGVNDRGTMLVDCEGYTFFITPFKETKKVVKHLQVDTIYSDLVKDLSARDFTLNTIAMTPSGKRIDVFGGEKDFKHGVIKTVINPVESFKEDPIRILRAIRLVSQYNYHLSPSVKKAIYNKGKLLKKATFADMDFEMNMLCDGQYAKKAFKLIKKFDLCAYMGVYKKATLKMCKHYTKMPYVDFLCASLVLNEYMDDSYLLSVNNIESFKGVYNCALANPKCTFDDLTLFSYGIDVVTRALKINKFIGTAKTKQKVVDEKYRNLPIKKTCDLAFKGEDIIDLIGDNNPTKIEPLIDEVVYNIIKHKLRNDKDEIRDYILTIVTPVNKSVPSPKPVVEESNYREPEAISSPIPSYTGNNPTYGTEEKEILDDLNAHRIDMLEKRLNAQEKSIEEKNQLIENLLNGYSPKMVNDVNDVVNDSINKLKMMNYLGEEDSVLEQELRQMLMNHLKQK